MNYCCKKWFMEVIWYCWLGQTIKPSVYEIFFICHFDSVKSWNIPNRKVLNSNCFCAIEVKNFSALKLKFFHCKYRQEIKKSAVSSEHLYCCYFDINLIIRSALAAEISAAVYRNEKMLLLLQWMHASDVKDFLLFFNNIPWTNRI